MKRLLYSSYLLNARRALEDGDCSFDAASWENSTEKCDVLPTTQTGNTGFL